MLKNRSKRKLISLLSVLGVLAVVPLAFGEAYCVDTYGESGALCGSHCDYYDGERYMGSIDIDYNC